jgi:hypothetical protein
MGRSFRLKERKPAGLPFERKKTGRRLVWFQAGLATFWRRSGLFRGATCIKPVDDHTSGSKSAFAISVLRIAAGMLLLEDWP